jgi:hypothetical protein
MDGALAILAEALSDEPPAQPTEDIAEASTDNPAAQVAPPASEPAALPTAPADNPQDNNPLDYTPISEAIKSGFEAIKQELAQAESAQSPSEPAEPSAPEAPALPDPEKFLEEFGTDPAKAIAVIASQMAQKAIDEYKQRTEQELAPMRRAAQAETQKEAVKNALIGFFTNPEFPDAQDMGEDIINVIKQDKLPLDDPISFERAYNKVKIGRLSQNKPLEAYLSDEESLGKLMADPRISKPLIEKYLQGVAGGAAPAVITQGSLPSAAPSKVPTTLDEAKQRLVEYFA